MDGKAAPGPLRGPAWAGGARRDGALGRLDEPLRVAMAGRIKAGKSTLINAFLGEQVAPTDTSECTRVVTWYRGGPSPRVRVVPLVGDPVERPVHRVDGRLQLDTAGLPVTDVRRIEVTWPSPTLSDLTLIDTPGLASLSEEISQQSLDTLVPDGSTSEVDAVVYLLRHLHAQDADVLEAFRDQQGRTAGPATTLGVLSRADEVGAGRLDALLGAERVAGRYREDPAVRGLCIDVIPVAGLLAEGARTLRQAEFDALRELATLGRREREQLLMSADRFIAAPTSGSTDTSGEVRARLLDRLGVYGVRLSLVLIRDGFETATALSDELVRRSGLDRVAQVLTVQFAGRADALKARTALLALRRELDTLGPDADVLALREEVEAALHDAHELDEMRLLADLRSGRRPDIGTQRLADADRLIGGEGTAATARLELSERADRETVREAALARVREWREVESDPALGHAEVTAARTVIRSIEGLLHDLDPDPRTR